MDFDVALLPLLVIFPLVGGLLLPRLTQHEPQRVRTYALIVTIINFVISLMMFVGFDFVRADVIQLQTQIDWVPTLRLSMNFGVDAIGLWLVLLTTFLMPVVILSSFESVHQRAREFYMWLLILEAAMIGVFVANDIIFFYISFEFTLVPLYFLIGIHGSSQRLKAAKVFFMYTFSGSMLTFAGVLYVAWHYGWTFNIERLVQLAGQPMGGLSPQEQMWVMGAMLAGFAVKVPLFPVHTWLPLAHTEAPTAGSAVLAGVLLKLGTYALIHLAIPLAPIAALTLSPWIAGAASIGIVYAALICWVQKDIKRLVAYSSVSHLGFCVLGMFALNAQGLGGSVIYMINHGLSTGALFLLIGMIYDRFHTREMSQMSGLARVMPVWSFFMIYFCLASVGLPGLNGFVGEFLTLLGAFTSENLGPRYAVFAGLGLILGAIYILVMLAKVVWGPLKLPETAGHDAGHGHGHARLDLNLREIVVLIPLALACLWLGLYPRCVLDTLEAPSLKIMQQTNRVTGPTVRVLTRMDPRDATYRPVSERAEASFTAPWPHYPAGRRSRDYGYPMSREGYNSRGLDPNWGVDR
ncbi:MAG: NADH-quinone oxidoreductase subunit M [Phycisphaeraceae bacterium]|nr:NADH-quinone oxidoreductase subunit M [Phycisphaeraceae bacterium]